MVKSDLIAESPSRLERKRARNRDALVGAARKLFGEKGFEAATVADITTAADLGFGTFYRYFADKEAVLEAVLEDGRRELDEVLLDRDGHETAVGELMHLSAGFIRAVRRNRDLLMLGWRIAMGETKGRRPLRIDYGAERSLPAMLHAAIQRIVECGMRDGEFAAGDASLSSGFIAGMHMSLLGPQSQMRDEDVLIRALCDFELRALGVRDGAELAGEPGRNGR